MAGNRDFDSGRFKELVLLLAQRSASDPRMSRVKLNKLLYHADFEAFRLLGYSLTGATYIKGEYGPMAKELPLAEDELGARGYLAWSREGPHARKVPHAAQGAGESLFTADELGIIESALAELASRGGKGASEWSHEESAGWRAKKLGETISYESGLVDPSPADADAVAFLRKLEQIA